MKARHGRPDSVELSGPVDNFKEEASRSTAHPNTQAFATYIVAMVVA
ncbi:hypothetical protein [Bradyrhizobium sp. LTSP885]|nr:hypothetical protein [Bradyrhizobium sp. LTSP885]